MRTRLLTGVSLGVLATVALAISGCSANSDTTTPGTSSSAGIPSAPASSGAADSDAAAALGTAAAALDDTSFKMTMTSGHGLKVTGQIDAPNGKGTADIMVTGPNAEITVKTLLVDKDLYVQVPGVTKPGKWTHVDVARLPEGANVGLRPDQIDPANTAQLLASTTDVQTVDSRSYKGSLDLTKVAGLTGLSKVTIDSYGNAAQKVPFTAGLDDQGRLSALTIQLPAANGGQAQPLEILYTGYGAPVTAERPAASQIIEAPNSLYTSLGS